MPPLKWTLGLLEQGRVGSEAALVALESLPDSRVFSPRALRDWIATRTRLPAREDADEDGRLWAYGAIDGVVYKIAWNDVGIPIAGTGRHVHTHWLTKPEIPPPAPPTRR
jgi:hypothetical protein